VFFFFFKVSLEVLTLNKNELFLHPVS